MDRKQLEKKVFQALGEASMCWSEPPKGEFESVRCKAIGDKLMADFDLIVNEVENAVARAFNGSWNK